MTVIFNAPFGQKRCRNTEAEKDYNAPVSMIETEIKFEDIALSDRIMDLMENPNAADTNFWYDFWGANSDVWEEMISVNPRVDITDLDEHQLRYRVSVLFNFLESLQLSAEAQAMEERNDEN